MTICQNSKLSMTIHINAESHCACEGVTCGEGEGPLEVVPLKRFLRALMASGKSSSVLRLAGAARSLVKSFWLSCQQGGM